MSKVETVHFKNVACVKICVCLYSL